jgi:hypothetical protein
METFRLIKLKENKHLKKTDDNMLDLSWLNSFPTLKKKKEKREIRFKSESWSQISSGPFSWLRQILEEEWAALGCFGLFFST